MRIAGLLALAIAIAAARHYDSSQEYPAEDYDDAWENGDESQFKNRAHNFQHHNSTPTDPPSDTEQSRKRVLRSMKKRYAEREETYDDMWMSAPNKLEAEAPLQVADIKKRSDTWCEYEDSYLGGYSSGTYKYDNLASAQAACLERDDCGGITQEPSRYTLRVGPDVRASPSGETSWIICETGDANVEEAFGSVRYSFGRTLEPGDYLEVYGTYVAGSSKFSVNIRDDNNNYLLHADFRPTYAVVLNSYNWGWQTEVRPDYPGFAADELFKITVVFMDDHYKIYVNDEPLSLTFPYRVEISTATYLWLGGGSNGFAWSSIKMPGDEKSDVYTLKDSLSGEVESLAETIRANVEGKSVSKIRLYVNSTQGSLDVLQWQLLRKIDNCEELMDLTDPTISWILNDQETLQTFMISGDVENDNYKGALEILAEIIEQDPEVKSSAIRLRLAVATALTFASDVHSLATWDNLIDGIAKYHTYISWMEEDVLFAPFYEISAWHLRYVIGSWQESEELVWARANALESYQNADMIADVTHQMVEYKLYNDDGVSVHEGSAYYYYQPVTLQTIHEVGGVCGAISKFATGMAQAFGIPALPVGQPGHCAYIWYKNGGWTLGNDVSGWDESSTHSGIQYSWMMPSVYFPLMNDAQANLESYRLSEKMRIATKLADPSEMFEILEDASTECPQNFAIWEDLEDALNEPTLGVDTVQDALQPSLVAYRAALADLVNIVPGKDITATCSDDDTNNIIDDENDSEWYCTDETATFEVDLAAPCTINEVQIRWWGQSKASNFLIYAMSAETGEYSVVKTQEDETVDGTFNHWSYMTGWDMKTRKIKVELNDGMADYWGMGVLFGIRQFRVLGWVHEDVEVVSAGQPITANSESTGVSALLDADNSTIWEGNSDNSWFEINLQKICALEDIELVWDNGAETEKVVKRNRYRKKQQEPTDTVEVEVVVGSGPSSSVSEEGRPASLALDMLASTIRVKLEGGDQSLAGVKVCGAGYSAKDILKIKVQTTLDQFPYVERDLLSAIEEFEYATDN